MKKSKKAKIGESAGAVAGHHNNITTSGTLSSNLDIETLLYFRQLSYSEKIQVIDYMINLHEKNGPENGPHAGRF